MTLDDDELDRVDWKALDCCTEWGEQPDDMPRLLRELAGANENRIHDAMHGIRNLFSTGIGDASCYAVLLLGTNPRRSTIATLIGDAR